MVRKQAFQITTASEKETISFNYYFCQSRKASPMIIFPYLTPPKELNSMPERWVLAHTESGRMKSKTFFEYVANCFDKWLDNKIYKKTHLTLNLSKFCSKRKQIVAPPPNTTNIVQVADVSLFKLFK